jgi:tetratricopeptide (TPR) repeat protein
MTRWNRYIGALCVAGILWAAPQSPGQAAYEKANAFFVAKKFPESLAAIEEALRLDPKLVPALTLKAKLAMASNRYDVARQSLQRALAIDPKSGYAQFLYGLEAFLTNDMKEALPRFRRARELSPNDPRAALYLGLTVESVGSPEEALALYQDAVKLESAAGNLHADTLLPGAKLLMLLGRLDESEQWLRRALKLTPGSRDAHFELARLLLKRGDAAKAAEEGETALGLSEGAASETAIRYLLVRAWQQDGKPERAAAHADVIRTRESKAENPPK